MIKVHIVSETEWVTQGQGVHTAFVELVQLLKTDARVQVVINNEGGGDVFHSHTYGPYYFWKGRRYKGRRVLTVHVIPDSSRGTIPFAKMLMPLTRAYLKAAYDYADFVVAVSPMVEQELKKMGVRSEIVRISNPVLLDNWSRTPENREKGRKLLNLTKEEKLVLGVGQLQQRKGVEDFIDVAVAMPEYQFVWVGGRPMGKFTEGIGRIDKRIREAPGNIRFMGLLELAAMPPMYAAADLFLFPSYQENCPLAPLEATACGLPVIFRDIPEYAALYPSPYLKAATTAGFISLVRMLFTDPGLYNEATDMSSRLLAEFDQQRVKNELIELYQRTLGIGPSRRDRPKS